VRPSVNGALEYIMSVEHLSCYGKGDIHLVAQHILCLQHIGSGDDARTDDEESGRDVLLVKIVDELGGVGRWAIVEASSVNRVSFLS
jgi:hypothetical protein